MPGRHNDVWKRRKQQRAYKRACKKSFFSRPGLTEAKPDPWHSDPFNVQTWDAFRRYVQTHTALCHLPAAVIEIVISYCRRGRSELRLATGVLLEQMRAEFGLPNLSAAAGWDTPSECHVMQLERLQQVMREYTASSSQGGHPALSELAPKVSHVLVCPAETPEQRRDPSSQSAVRCPRSGWNVCVSGLQNTKLALYVILTPLPMPEFGAAFKGLLETVEERQQHVQAWKNILDSIRLLRASVVSLFKVRDVCDEVHPSDMGDQNLPFGWVKDLYERWLKEAEEHKLSVKRTSSAMFKLRVQEDPERFGFDGVGHVCVSFATTARALFDYLNANEETLERETRRMCDLSFRLQMVCFNTASVFPDFVVADQQLQWWHATPRMQEIIDAYKHIHAHRDDINRHIMFSSDTPIWIRPPDPGNG